MSDGPVVDDTVNSRFLVEEDGAEAELVYRNPGRRLVLVHTEVPEALGGRGIGGRLVAAAVERARREGLVLVPVCPYARQWLEKHVEATEGISIDWPADEPAPDEDT